MEPRTFQRRFARRMAPPALAAAAVLAASPWLGAAAHGRPWLLAIASALLTVGAGLLFFLWPQRAAAKLAEELAGTLDKLRLAESRSRQTSEDLSRWVASAVDQVRELSERIVQIHEAERGRMARDLHDGMGQTLAALQLDLELLRSRPADNLLVNRALAACDDAMAELRRVVYDLRPPELSEHAEVSEVLRACVERFEIRAGMPTSFRAAGRRLESEEISTCLLRVLQEALTNVSRHAFAREVGVSLRVDPDEVLLQVQDDGQGFDPSGPARGRGLRGMHERCAFLGGSVSVDSGPGRGTRLEIRLPVGAAGHA